jgi:hypothetical protein
MLLLSSDGKVKKLRRHRLSKPLIYCFRKGVKTKGGDLSRLEKKKEKKRTSFG